MADFSRGAGMEEDFAGDLASRRDEQRAVSDEFLRGYYARAAEELQRQPPGRRSWVTITVAVIVALAILGAAFLYVGEKHRALCLRDGYDGCSMLPWSGQPASGWGGTSGVVIPSWTTATPSWVTP